MKNLEKYFKTMTPQKAIITAVVLILAFFVLKKLWQYIKPTNFSADSFISGGGTIPAGWKPDEYTDLFYKAVKGWSFSPEAIDNASKEILTLADNQIIAISNDWKQRYADDYGMTMNEALKNEWGWVICVACEDYITALENRLDNLGV